MNTSAKDVYTIQQIGIIEGLLIEKVLLNGTAIQIRRFANIIADNITHKQVIRLDVADRANYTDRPEEEVYPRYICFSMYDTVEDARKHHNGLLDKSINRWDKVEGVVS